MLHAIADFELNKNNFFLSPQIVDGKTEKRTVYMYLSKLSSHKKKH